VELRRGVDHGGAGGFDLLRLRGDKGGAGCIDVERWKWEVLGRKVFIDFGGVGRYDRGQLGDCRSRHGCEGVETK